MLPRVPLPWQHDEIKIIKKLKFVLLTCLLPFLATKGSKVLKEKVNETELSKTVFSHLNAASYVYVGSVRGVYGLTCQLISQ